MPPQRRAKARRTSAKQPPKRAAARRESEVARLRALDALHRMRAQGLSLTQAADRALTTPATVRKYAGSALTRAASGRYRAKPWDRLARTLNVLTPRGVEQVTVRDSRTASRIAAHAAAVDRFLKTGDARALRPFRRQSFRAGKVAFPFLTDLRTLERLGNVGEVSFEDLYALKG